MSNLASTVPSSLPGISDSAVDGVGEGSPLRPLPFF